MNTADRAQSYALAFYEAAMERWLGSLDDVAGRLTEDESLMKGLQAPDVDFRERQAILDELLPKETDLPVRNLLYTLLERGDLSLLAQVSDSLRKRMRPAETAPVTAEVTSAVPLTGTQRSDLVARLEAQFGRGLEVQFRVDATILGGLVVRVGDKLIDGSVASRMAAMRQALGVTTAE